MGAADTKTEAETGLELAQKELAELLADPDVDKAAVRDKLLDECLDIVEYLRPVDAKNKRRIRLYLMIRELGVEVKELADFLGVTPESVRQALLKARRGRDGS